MISTLLIRYVNALILISTLTLHESIHLNAHCGYMVTWGKMAPGGNTAPRLICQTSEHKLTLNSGT